jgi:small-conductance mechanosensitive channel
MLEETATNIAMGIETFGGWLGDWGRAHLVGIIAILVGAWIIRRVALEFTSRLLVHVVRPDVYPTKADREKRVRTLRSLLDGIIRIIVYVVAGILLISEINPAYRTAILTSAGLFSVILGFGAQSLIRDLVSGLFIIVENQYRIGDEVTLVAGAGIGTVDGIVEDVTIRTTVLRDLNGNVHHMPNGNIGVTTNKTLGYSRMNENILVALDTNLEKLEEVIKTVGKELTTVPDLGDTILEPPAMASVKGFGDDGIIVRVSAKTSPAAQWRVRSEFYKRLKTALDKSHIKLAGQTEASNDED